MKAKVLSLSLASVFVLSACGGSDDDGSYNTTPNSNSSTQWSEFFLNTWDDVLEQNIETFTINQGRLYSKVVVGEEYEYFLVTEDGVYDIRSAKDTHGFLEGNIQTNNHNWILTPYSSRNATGLKITHDFKNINLEGKSIGYYAAPEDYIAKRNPTMTGEVGPQVSQYLTKAENLKFPNGSRCLQETGVSSTQSYLSLESGDQTKLKKQWDELVATPDVSRLKMDYKDTTAYFYKFGTDDTQLGLGVAKYNNTYYIADHAPVGAEYSLDDIIKDAENLISSSSSDAEKAYIQDYITYFKSHCSLYNPTALKAIRDSLEK